LISPNHCKNPQFFLHICLVILSVGWSSIGLTKNTIDIDITTHLGDQQTYVEGDRLEFLMNLSQDAFVLILYIDAADNITQVLPNDFTKNNHVKSGLYINIPNQSAPFQFSVSAPFGRETVWAYASIAPFPKLPGKELKNGLKQLKISLVKINALLKRHFSDKRQDFSSASLVIKTIAIKDQVRP